MNKWLLAVLVFFGFGLVTEHAQAPAEHIGRYQLLPADYTFEGPKGDLHLKGVFRIDTVTGKSWRYIYGTTADDKGYNDWFPIKE